MKNKRSQEEMIGFVLIIVLVAIVALIFLSISLRKSPVKIPSNEVESFLYSIERYSTECYASPEREYDIKDLIVSCSANEVCLNGEKSCDVLGRSLSGILDKSWKPGDENPVKYYNLKIYNKNTNKTVLALKQGNCTGIRTGSSTSIPIDGGIIKSELEICS